MCTAANPKRNRADEIAHMDLATQTGMLAAGQVSAVEPLDQEKLEAFVERIVLDAGTAMRGGLMYIGDRLGIFVRCSTRASLQTTGRKCCSWPEEEVSGGGSQREGWRNPGCGLIVGDPSRSRRACAPVRGRRLAW
ncbi:MAG: hypothetical protein ACLQMH_18710 [Solirubrobacteraceae bacterium]